MAHSYLAAAVALYDTLAAANFPAATRSPRHFGEAPVKDGSGTDLRPPYVVFADLGSAPEYQSDYGGPEPGGFTLTAYADTLADVDTIVTAVKWNGAAPANKAGFDFGTLTLDAPLYFLSLARTREVREYVAPGKSGQRVHRCVLTYRVETAVNPVPAPG